MGSFEERFRKMMNLGLSSMNLDGLDSFKSIKMNLDYLDDFRFEKMVLNLKSNTIEILKKMKQVS